MLSNKYVLAIIVFIFFTFLLSSDLLLAYFYNYYDFIKFFKIARDLLILLLGFFSIFYFVTVNTSRLSRNLRITSIVWIVIPIYLAIFELLRFSSTSFSKITDAFVLFLPLMLIFLSYLIAKYISPNIFIKILILFTILSALFSFYEILNTNFWVETINLPKYLLEVKGIHSSSTEYFTGLPHNFFRKSLTDRRAAGLLAAPLAQGNLLGVGLITQLFCPLFKKKYVDYVVNFILIFGLVLTGTRLAYVFIISYLFYLFFIDGLIFNLFKLLKSIKNNFLIVIVIVMCVTYLLNRYSYLFILSDSSSIGHFYSTYSNFNLLTKMNFFGYGLSSQSRNSNAFDVNMIGFGEGSFFSLAFQTGYLGLINFFFFLKSLLDLCSTKRFIHFPQSDILKVASVSIYSLFIMSLFNESLFTLTGFLPVAVPIGSAISYRLHSRIN